MLLGDFLTNPVTDAEWEQLSRLHNVWIDDVADILQSLEDAAQIAEGSFERTSVAGSVLTNIRERIEAAITEISGRTNELTSELSRLLE